MKILGSTRRRARCALLAIVLVGIVSTARAALLVYEPFDFTPGLSLDGQSGAIGMIGVCKANGKGTTPVAMSNRSCE